MVQEKSVVNTIFKSVLDASIGGIAFWVVGYAFAFGGQDGGSKSFIGNTDFFIRNDKQGYNQFSQFFFQLVFAQTSAGIVSGALAERSKLSAHFWASTFITAFVYPAIVHVAWSKSGYLSAYNDHPFRGVGAIDMGGSGVIHVTGGLIALIAAFILGPRMGRFYDEQGKPLAKPGYFRNFCPSFLLLGVFIAWVGW
jgi:Amt family ammonium transporter